MEANEEIKHMLEESLTQKTQGDHTRAHEFCKKFAVFVNASNLNSHEVLSVLTYFSAQILSEIDISKINFVVFCEQMWGLIGEFKEEAKALKKSDSESGNV